MSKETKDHITKGNDQGWSLPLIWHWTF